MNEASNQTLELLKQRFAAVEARIASACRRAGRARSDVSLVCVTKQIGSAQAALLPGLGVLDLGENRPQELWRKATLLPKTVRWHLIGHLQRNKIDRTLPLVHLIHSVDSLRLLDALEASASKLQREIPILLEVNVSREPSKKGFAPDALPSLADGLTSHRKVIIHGLMTMAALEEDPEKARPTFIALRKLAEELRGRVSPPHQLRELSMGMTNDFEVAIEEGATMVRIGSAFFANLPGASP
jgi:pyridoxal phosphate enzyme (YggS family)